MDVISTGDIPATGNPVGLFALPEITPPPPGQSEQLNGLIASPRAQDYSLILASTFALRLTGISAQLSSGSCTMSLIINSRTVHFTSGIEALTDLQLRDYPLDDAIAVGQGLILRVTSATGTPRNLAFTIKLVRA